MGQKYLWKIFEQHFKKSASETETTEHLQFCLPKKLNGRSMSVFSVSKYYICITERNGGLFNLCVKYWSNYL